MKALKILLLIIIWLVGVSLNIACVPFPLCLIIAIVFGALVGALFGVVASE